MPKKGPVQKKWNLNPLRTLCHTGQCSSCDKKSEGAFCSNYFLLAPSGALIAIRTYYWPSNSTTTPLFQIKHVCHYITPTFTFWATTATSKAITGLICWLHVYLMGTTGHHWWRHFGYILATFWLHFGNILAKFWLHFGYILAKFWLHSDFILTTLWIQSGYILATFWLQSDYIWSRFCLHSYFILTTF